MTKRERTRATVGSESKAWRKGLTVGKRIGLKFSRFPDGRIVYGPVWWSKLSKAIDAAVKRAVREAWQARGTHMYLCDNIGNQQARDFRAKLNAKYGTNL